MCYLRLMKKLSLLLILQCFFSIAPALAIGPSKKCDSAHYCLSKIDSLADFHSLSSDIEIGYGRAQVIKFAYDRRSKSEALYFFKPSPPGYMYHYEFAQAILGVTDSIPTFNKNYTGGGADREFNLGNIVELPSGDIVVELWNGDEMSAQYISKLIQTMKANLNVSFKFHPTSQKLEVEAEKSGVENVKTADLFKGINFIPLNTGDAEGYVQIIRADNKAVPCLDHTSIVVYERLPNDLPLVGGAITVEVQTPLSHVNVKSINRGTINFYWKDAIQKLAKFEGKPVRIHIAAGQKEPDIELLIPETKPTDVDFNKARKEIDAFWTARRPQINFALHSNLIPEELISFKAAFPKKINADDHQKWVETMGAKATNIAVLNNAALISGLEIKTPDGYGIPFSYYDQFMNEPQTWSTGSHESPNQVIHSLLEKNGLLTEELHSFCQAQPILENIRNTILLSMPPKNWKLLSLLKEQIIDNPNSPIAQNQVPRIRLRSSTNSEDLDGFSGAGLYESNGVNFYKRNDLDHSFQKNQPKAWGKIQTDLIVAIKNLYASVWSDRAFAEREWYSIYGEKHFAVKMAIAVHQAFPLRSFGDGVTPAPLLENANGVAISRNIYRPAQPEQVYINGQHLDFAITNPPLESDFNSNDYVSLNLKASGEYSTEELAITTMTAMSESDKAWPYWSIDRLRSSNLSIQGEQKSVLEENEARKLALAMRVLNRRLAPIYGKSETDFAIDVEWKLGANRELWFKQVRPFNHSQTSESSSKKDGGNFMVAPQQPKVEPILGPLRP
jgi:hypothetical protein